MADFGPALGSLGIGMAVPGTSGSSLQSQVFGETEEERRKRILEMQRRQLLPSLAAASPALQSALGMGGRI
jgi:hypothetical protein